MRKFSGFTTETAQSLLLNAGAFFKNFDPATDTFDSAVAAGKLIGATKGGGEFSAVPEVRQIEVDGVAGRAKGLEIIDSWDVYIKATVLEIKESTIAAGLAASSIDTTSNDDYDIIKAGQSIELSDYIENVAWVGTLSGSNKPVIIIITNAINTDGLVLTVEDKNEASIPMTFYGHYDQDDLENPPFEILYPKAVGYHGVEVTTDGHGAAAATVKSGAAGTVVGLVATPAAGYEFDKWTVIKGGVTIVDNTFTIGSSNVVIRADFIEE